MSRKVEFEINELLSLLLCSEYYEFNHDILYQTIAGKIGELTDDEINDFVVENSTSQDGEIRSEKEIEEIKSYLFSVREEYFNTK